jgi:hypothetical protein
MANKTLPDLPTEILYRIFAHCDSETIFLSVRYVCKRLYAITDTYDRLELNVDSNLRDASKLIYRLIDPSKISSLTVLGSTHSSYQNNSIISFIDMHQFTHLRSLTFHCISGRILEQFVLQITINSLDSLSIGVFEYEYREISTLPSLAIVHLNPREFFFNSTHPITNHQFSPIDCQLEHLTLGKCDYIGCLIILQQLPRLQTFSIIEFKMAVDAETTLPFTESSFCSSLSSLSIDEHYKYCQSISSTSLVSSLTRTPALVYLKLISRRETFDYVFDGSYWEQLIQSKLPSLKTFEFCFWYSPYEKSNMIDIDPPITSFQTPFWLREKNWIINCAYIIESPGIWLPTTTAWITYYENSPKCEISAIDNVWRFTRQSSQILSNLEFRCDYGTYVGAHFICRTLRDNKVNYLQLALPFIYNCLFLPIHRP